MLRSTSRTELAAQAQAFFRAHPRRRRPPGRVRGASVFLPFALLVAGLLAVPPEAGGQLRIRDICRVKGQEQNTLHGIGLVAGLNGSGDGDKPTTRSLAKMMELMGTPVSVDQRGQPLLEELKNARNVAMVFVTATVPAEGARRGAQLNCTVNAIGAKSLEGGYLLLTPLLGPRPGDTRIYGYAQGSLKTERSGPPTSARIHGGCRLEADFTNDFVKDGKITLVLDKNHASFRTAFDIEDVLNDPQTFGGLMQDKRARDNPRTPGAPIAKAIDQVNIEVTIPPAYLDRPVQFVYEVLDSRIFTPQNDACVVINERSGVVVIGDNVEVGAVAVTHGNLSVQIGGGPLRGPLFVVDQTANTSTTRLQALVDALNALQVNTQDIIDIIKELERSGELFGRVIIE